MLNLKSSSCFMVKLKCPFSLKVAPFIHLQWVPHWRPCPFSWLWETLVYLETLLHSFHLSTHLYSSGCRKHWPLIGFSRNQSSLAEYCDLLFSGEECPMPQEKYISWNTTDIERAWNFREIGWISRNSIYDFDWACWSILQNTVLEWLQQQRWNFNIIH